MMKTVIKILLIILYILYATAAGAQQVNGYMKYRYVDVDSALGIPADTLTLSPAAKLKPHMAISKDSTFMIWSVALQKYIIPRSASSSVSVYWSDILGPISGNLQLMDSLAAKQQVLPYSGGTTDYIGGDHLVHSIDSILASMDFVRSTDTIFQNIQSGTADSLHFENGLYRTGNYVYVHYEWPIWDANKIQGKFVEAIQPRNKSVMQWDSLTNVLRWTPLDSLSGGITQAQLDDTAAAIRAAFPSYTTPNLEQVLTAGHFATSNINTSGDIYGSSVQSLQGGIGYSMLSPVSIGPNYAGAVFMRSLSNNGRLAGIYADTITGGGDYFFRLIHDSVQTSTIATREWVTKQGYGAGGGATPGIDDVLAVGQSLSAARTINTNGTNFLISSDGLNGATSETFEVNPNMIKAFARAGTSGGSGHYSGLTLWADTTFGQYKTWSQWQTNGRYSNGASAGATITLDPYVGVSIGFGAGLGNFFVSSLDTDNGSNPPTTSPAGTERFVIADGTSKLSYAKWLRMPTTTSIDTLATLSDVRAAGGGGGGSSTPTLQDVLAAGSTLTGDHDIVGDGSNYFGMYNWAGYSFDMPNEPTDGTRSKLTFDQYSFDILFENASFDGARIIGQTGTSTKPELTLKSYTSGTTQALHIRNNEIVFNAESSGAFLILKLEDLQTFADDSSAASGGLATGTIYKTSTGELRIKL